MTAIITLALPVTQGVVLAAQSDAAGGSSPTNRNGGAGQIEEVQYPDLPPQAPDDFSSVRYINVQFQTRGHGNPYNFDFPYTDEMFSQPADEFSITMAQASLGLAISAFRSFDPAMRDQHDAYLSGAGFRNICAFGYEGKTWSDTLAGVIASRRISDTTVIAIAPCGQGYGKEWAGNLWIGDDTVHNGFRTSSGILRDQVYQYIENNNITGSITLWLTGFSRAAATANLAAGGFVEDGCFDAVYAYLFAVPNNTRAPVAYEGIYNICGKYDPVPLVPWSSWGYGRHGIDLYTPAQEMDSDYQELRAAASAVEESITGTTLRNNPEHNYQMRLLLEAIPEIFPEVDDYVAGLQEPLMNALLRQDTENLIDALITAGGNMSRLKVDTWSYNAITDYISYLVTEHLSGNKRQIEGGNWDESNDVTQNLMAEHQVIVYLDWLFSGLDYEDLFGGALNSRRLVINGDVAVSVYRDGELAGDIDIDGNTGGGGADRVFLMRSGNVINVILPMDAGYEVRIDMPRAGAIDYHNIIQSTNILPGQDGESYICGLQPGEYALNFDTTSSLPEIEVIDGGINYAVRDTHEYSVRTIMMQESGSTFHLTPELIIMTFKWMVISLGVMLFICFLLGTVQRIMRRHGHAPFSPLYVIIPHVLLIAWFAFLTEFMVRYLNVIASAKSICATITAVLIFFLALRGFIRNRGKMTFFITFMTGIIAVAAWFGFALGPMADFSVIKAVIFTASVVFLTFLAIWNFYRGGVKEN